MLTRSSTCPVPAVLSIVPALIDRVVSIAWLSTPESDSIR